MSETHTGTAEHSDAFDALVGDYLPEWVVVYADYRERPRDRRRRDIDRMLDAEVLDIGKLRPPESHPGAFVRTLAACKEFYERFGTDYTDREEYDVTWPADEAPFADAETELEMLAAQLVAHYRDVDSCPGEVRDGRVILVPQDTPTLSGD